MNVKFSVLVNGSYDADLEEQPEKPIAVATKVTT